MTIGQAATRLRLDSSTCGKYIRHGLDDRNGGVYFLGATWTRNPKTKRKRWEITAPQLRAFAAARKRLGLR